MAEVIRMPRMSDTMEEGVLVGWLKKVGDAVEPGDVLAEVETDKATMELESFQEGVLLYIGVKEGPVPVNGVLAVIGEEGEDYKAALKAAESTNDNGSSSTTEVESAESTESTPAAKSARTSDTETVTAEKTTIKTDQRIKASPLARNMASETGIDLSNVTGTGDNGRIVKKDIEALLKSSDSKAASSTPAIPSEKQQQSKPQVFPGAPTNEKQYEDVPLSQMRKVIARRLGESKFSAPHFYLTVEINMGKASVARKQMNEIAPTKISFNDLVVKSCAVALQQHPAINASWMGDKIRYNREINIGVAVAVEEGLLVPVIRNVNYKSLSQINTEVRELAGKAKDRRLQPDQMQGNTFTVSNLGMFGIEAFTAIINPPDSCILAVGSIIEKPVVKDGELAIGHMMKVTLSCDHRVVDGATGAKFLQTLKMILEEPIRLVV